MTCKSEFYKDSVYIYEGISANFRQPDLFHKTYHIIFIFFSKKYSYPRAETLFKCLNKFKKFHSCYITVETTLYHVCISFSLFTVRIHCLNLSLLLWQKMFNALANSFGIFSLFYLLLLHAFLFILYSSFFTFLAITYSNRLNFMTFTHFLMTFCIFNFYIFLLVCFKLF